MTTSKTSTGTPEASRAATYIASIGADLPPPRSLASPRVGWGEAALGVVGLDPPVRAQHAQRPHHGRPGDLELIAQLMLARQQRPRRVLAGLDPPPQLVNDLGVLRRGVLIGHGVRLTQVTCLLKHTTVRVPGL